MAGEGCKRGTDTSAFSVEGKGLSSAVRAFCTAFRFGTAGNGSRWVCSSGMYNCAGCFPSLLLLAAPAGDDAEAAADGCPPERSLLLVPAASSGDAPMLCAAPTPFGVSAASFTGGQRPALRQHGAFAFTFRHAGHRCGSATPSPLQVDDGRGMRFAMATAKRSIGRRRRQSAL